MEVRANLRYLRIAPRKVRLVIDLIRGMKVDQAADQLSVLPKRAALPVMKLMNSAIANAEHNFQLKRENLRIKTIVANEGPRLKRYQARAFGQGAPILKRTSHVTIILEDLQKTVAPKKEKAAKVATTKVDAATVKQAPVEPSVKDQKPVKSAEKKSPTAKSKARDAQDKLVRRQGKS